MTTLLLRKHLGSLRPVDEAGEEALRKIKQGDVIKCDVRKPRNIKHHRLYWALCSLILQNQSRYLTVEEISDVIKLRTGHCHLLAMPDGAEFRVPDSISFAKMDQTAFDAFFNRVCDFVCAELLPGVSNADLRLELGSMVGWSIAA